MGLGEAQLCDACYNDRVAALTGSAPLPRPPPPMVIIGPDGRSHRLAYRILRAPAGVEVKLEETGVEPGQGYGFAVLGDHDAHVAPLLRQVRTIAEREVARQYLEPATHGAGWRVTDGDEVVGRFIWSDEGAAGAPFDVVIDGRTLTWEQFGEALSAYEGWNFRLLIEDRVAEAETETEAEAEVINIARHRSRPGPLS
jgi:hypothetical protein